jgi:THO complex subunit 2
MVSQDDLCHHSPAKLDVGRFLARILADLWKWFETKKDYEEEHYVTVNKKSTVLPGFGRVWASKGPEESVQQTYDYFKSAVKKWYRTLAKVSFVHRTGLLGSNCFCQCFCACIESGEFMHIKNAILVLQRISDYFPMAAVEHKEGPMVNAAVEKFLQNGEKGSLQVLCQSYHSTLQKRASGWQVSAKGTAKAPEADAAPSTRGTRPPVVRRESGPAEDSGANQSLPPPPRPERSSSSSRPSPLVLGA